MVVAGRYYTRGNMGQLPDDIKLSSTIQVQLDRPTGVCGKVLSEQNG